MCAYLGPNNLLMVFFLLVYYPASGEHGGGIVNNYVPQDIYNNTARHLVGFVPV